jgi:hypothetical protein
LSAFSRFDVPRDAISIVDGVFVLYVLIPPKAPRTRNEAGIALQFAKDLAERPNSDVSVAFVVSNDSAPPYDLKAIFRQWRDESWPFPGTEISCIDLDGAFDHLDRDKYSIKELQGDFLPIGVDAEKLEVTPISILSDVVVFSE